MNTETRLLPGGEYASSSFNGSGEQVGSSGGSLRDQIEAEKRAKIEELLAPYRAKRAEMQTKRDEFAQALEGLDRDLAELDSVIGQVEASVGLAAGSRGGKKKKGSAASSSASAARAKEGRPAATDDWVIQKLRECPRGPLELGKAAKEEGFKASSIRAIIERLLEANVVRVNGDGGYEMV